MSSIPFPMPRKGTTSIMVGDILEGNFENDRNYLPLSAVQTVSVADYPDLAKVIPGNVAATLAKEFGPSDASGIYFSQFKIASDNSILRIQSTIVNGRYSSRLSKVTTNPQTGQITAGGDSQFINAMRDMGGTQAVTGMTGQAMEFVVSPNHPTALIVHSGAPSKTGTDVVLNRNLKSYPFTVVNGNLQSTPPIAAYTAAGNDETIFPIIERVLHDGTRYLVVVGMWKNTLGIDVASEIGATYVEHRLYEFTDPGMVKTLLLTEVNPKWASLETYPSLGQFKYRNENNEWSSDLVNWVAIPKFSNLTGLKQVTGRNANSISLNGSLAAKGDVIAFFRGRILTISRNRGETWKDFRIPFIHSGQLLIESSGIVYYLSSEAGIDPSRRLLMIVKPDNTVSVQELGALPRLNFSANGGMATSVAYPGDEYAGKIVFYEGNSRQLITAAAAPLTITLPQQTGFYIRARK